jgi:hypothetical protein
VANSFHAVAIKVTLAAADKGPVGVDALAAALEPFIATACGAARQGAGLIFQKPDVLIVWGARQLPAELRAEKDATAEPLSAKTQVRVTTQGASPIARTFVITKPGPLSAAVKRAPVNIDNAMAAFRARVGEDELQKDEERRQAAKKKIDDEWSD